MIITIPKSLKNKVTFTFGGTKIIEGAILSKSEYAEFIEFKKRLQECIKKRFED